MDDINHIKTSNAQETKLARDSQLEKIVESIRRAANEVNFEADFETKGLAVPRLASKNPLYPSFSDCVDIVHSADRGRMAVASRDIEASSKVTF